MPRRRPPPCLPADLLDLVRLAGFEDGGLRAWCEAAQISVATLYSYRSRGKRPSTRQIRALLAVAKEAIDVHALATALCLPTRGFR